MSKYCDDCLTIAYDNGVFGIDAQKQFLSIVGQEIEDHICIQTEEPELKIKCLCSCNNN